MRATHQGESGFTLVEMMIVLVLISILSAIATVTLGSSSHRAYVAAMQSDLRNVIAAQEAYIEQMFAETGTATYANNVTKLPVNLSNGVTIRMRGNANGWTARATHARVSGARCAVFRGNVNPFAPATDDGRIECD